MVMHDSTATTHGRMVAQPATVFAAGGSNPCHQCRRRRRRHVHLAGVRTADQKTTITCTTIRPLSVTAHTASPLLGSKSATDEKPKLCVSLSPDINTTTAAPPPPSMEVRIFLPPSMTFFKAPSREPRRGGVRERGSNDPPPPRASQFSPTQVIVHTQLALMLLMHPRLRDLWQHWSIQGIPALCATFR